MLDGPGNLEDIQPRRNRLARRRDKQVPFELAPPPTPQEQRLVKQMLITSSIVIFFILGIPLIGLLSQKYPIVMDAISIIVLLVGAVIVFFVIYNALLHLVVPAIASLVSLPSYVMDAIGDTQREQQRERERRERSFRRYMKKITRIDRKIAAGAEYKLGADGEIVLIEKNEKTDDYSNGNASEDTAYQITDDGELAPTVKES